MAKPGCVQHDCPECKELRARLKSAKNAVKAKMGIHYEVTPEMVDRFLSWELPKTVCADLCAADPDYPHQRTGTNLLNAVEAKAMLEHVIGAPSRMKKP